MATAAKSKLQQEIAPTPDADPLFVLAPMEAPRCGALPCLACDGCRRDDGGDLCRQHGDDPQSLACLRFAGDRRCRWLRPWSLPLLSRTWGSRLQFFPDRARYTLRVDDPANIWAIGLLFVVGCIASAVASTSRRRARDAALRGRQATVLHGYGRDVVAADNTKAIAATTAGALAALFQVPVVVILSEGNGFSVERAGDIELQEAEHEAARSALSTGTVMRAGIYPTDASRFDFWPVATAVGQPAVIGLAFDPDERPSAPDVLVGIVGSLLALALDRQHCRVGLDTRPVS